MQVELTNQTKKLCVIGDPIGHTKSPLLQNTMLRALGLDYIYMAQHVPAGGGAQWLQAARTAGYAGFNATMPHKEELVPLMDHLDEDARLYGAVNTVALRGGEAWGYNTDGKGFCQALRQAGFDPQGKRVVLLGAGGAAKSVALKLVQQGAVQVAVCNRTLSRAEALCGQASGGVLVPAPMERGALARLLPQADLLVNCTSLGMAGTEGQFDDLSFLDDLPGHALVFDLIYAPAETLFLREARLRGHRTVNGLPMLMWQAIFALEQFVGRDIDGEEMVEVLAPIFDET